MNKNILFLTGMYRSGTTLAARLLQSQDQVVCASDPIRPFFNFYRTFLQKKALIPDEHVSDPLTGLNDYFNDPYFPLYLKTLVDSSFHQPLEVSTKPALIQAVKERAQQFSPSFAKKLSAKTLESSITWSDALNTFFDLIDSTYRGEKKINNACIFAFKEVWSIEMALPLLKHYKGSAKTIFILRDPKGVAASSKAKSGNYPLLYLARQWRKQFLFANYIKSVCPDNVRIIKYEDLCRDPESVMKSVLQFSLPLDIAPKPINLTPIGDDFRPWTQNSSHRNTAKSFAINSNSINQWKSVLSLQEEQWIESLCALRDNPYGYTNFKLPMCDYPKRQIETVSDWMKSYTFEHEHKNFEEEMSSEEERMLELIKSPSNEIDFVRTLNLQV